MPSSRTPPGRCGSSRREEILNYIGLLAAAGNETTTRLIGWSGKVLAEHPDQRRQLAEDPGLVPAAIEELLRFESPSPVQARYVTRDVEHYGVAVPEGSVLLLMNGAANRDERKFDDPDRFDIHRTQQQHLAFGYGIHFCLGSHLARLEGRIALEEVLKRCAELGSRLGQRGAGPHLDRPRLGVAAGQRGVTAPAPGFARTGAFAPIRPHVHPLSPGLGTLVPPACGPLALRSLSICPDTGLNSPT